MELPATHTAKQEWTYSELLKALDEDIYCELIDNQLFIMPSPSTEHQEITGEIAFLMMSVLKTSATGGKVFSAPYDVVFSEGHVVQPDILYINAEKINLIDKRCFRGAPDLLVEVVSPTSANRDYISKRALYERFGVTEYWIIDIANQAVTQLVLKDGKYEIACALSAEDETPQVANSVVLTGFALTTMQIFPSKENLTKK